MGDRLGTPGVVDFMFFSFFRSPFTQHATRKSGSNLKTSHCNSRKSQIKKSKLILVTAFKVGFHFFFFAFRISIFGWAGILITNETITLRTLHCIRKIFLRPSYVKLDRLHLIGNSYCLRPYHDEYTRSRPITEVKHRRARTVLGWGTAWEHLVS